VCLVSSMKPEVLLVHLRSRSQPICRLVSQLQQSCFRKRGRCVRVHWVLSALSISATGCSEAPLDYIALQLGARWEYAAEVRIGEDTLTGRNVFEIADDLELFADKSYYRTIETASGFGEQEPVVRYGRKADDGVYELDQLLPGRPEYLLLPSALEIGDEWAMMNATGDSLTCRVGAIEGIQVPAGQYEDCIKIVCSGRKSLGGHAAAATIVEHRAPGVGLVRAVTEWGTAVITLRLLSHDAGHPPE
jgi:hypothetical protein